jgi:hypothetical protein
MEAFKVPHFSTSKDFTFFQIERKDWLGCVPSVTKFRFYIVTNPPRRLDIEIYPDNVFSNIERVLESPSIRETQI